VETPQREDKIEGKEESDGPTLLENESSEYSSEEDSKDERKFMEVKNEGTGRKTNIAQS
jgi:hypothetical protein